MKDAKKIKPLKGFNIFSDVFKIAQKKRSNSLLIAFTISDTIQEELYLGVAAPKKLVKKAVCRNRIKRLLRESVRQLNKENSDLFMNVKQIILIWQVPLQSPKLLHLNEVKEEVKNLLSTAIKNIK